MALLRFSWKTYSALWNFISEVDSGWGKTGARGGFGKVERRARVQYWKMAENNIITCENFKDISFRYGELWRLISRWSCDIFVEIFPLNLSSSLLSVLSNLTSVPKWNPSTILRKLAKHTLKTDSSHLHHWNTHEMLKIYVLNQLLKPYVHFFKRPNTKIWF